MSILSLAELTVRYGANVALDRVSIAVEEGQLVALIGPNGAGKTTLLMSIQGMVRPASGRICFTGHDIVGLPPHRIVPMGIAHVPEGRRILARLTVIENLLIGAHQRRDRVGVRRDLDRLFDRFPVLREKVDLAAGLLSGGEQQMLAIARALVARPKLLLLDEPSIGLAPIVVASVFELIERLHREEGLSILLVEQNAYRALRIADHAYLLAQGRVVQEGRPAELIEQRDLLTAYLGGTARPPEVRA